MSTTLQLLALLAIVLWNAFFVAAEYAFVAARPSRLEEMASGGSRRAQRVLTLQENPTLFISAVQVAITMASLAAGAVGEPVVRGLISDALDPLGGEVITVISIFLGFSTVTAITVVLGEIVPKTLSLAKAEAVAIFAVGPVRVFSVILKPFIWLLERLSGIVTRSLGLPPARRLGRGHSEEELKLIVAASYEEGVLEADEQAMLARVFDFGETEVRQVMVPRPDVVALPGDATVNEAAALALERPFTRYPVVGERGLDDVLGVVHVRQLFRASRDPSRADRELSAIVRPVQMVPETKRLDELLRDFRRTKSHLAAVVDEYGQLAGVVSLEDLLEEIVGEISDEFDVPSQDIVRINESRALVNASFGIEDFNDRFGTRFSTDDFNSIGGVVFDTLGRLPRVGDHVERDGVAFTVREMEGSRLTRLEVLLPPAPVEQAARADGAAESEGEQLA